MGCRPQMVFPYFLKYSVNALGSPCKQTALNQLGFVRPSDFLENSQSSDCSTVLEKYLLNDVHALCVQPLYSFVDGPLHHYMTAVNNTTAAVMKDVHAMCPDGDRQIARSIVERITFEWSLNV